MDFINVIFPLIIGSFIFCTTNGNFRVFNDFFRRIIAVTLNRDRVDKILLIRCGIHGLDRFIH